LITTIKQPEYTGDNRCLPCTILNSLISVGLAVLIGGTIEAVVGSYGVLVGILVVVVCLAVIYLRGYLVPGTPALTKRYLPTQLRGWFKSNSRQPLLDGTDPTELLVEIGVVVDDPSAADYTLAPVFLEEWRESIRLHWGDEELARESLGKLSGADPDSLAFEHEAQRFRVTAEGLHLATWPSREACIADAAAARELVDWDPDWSRRRLVVQSDILGALRLFIERCPACDGTVSLSHEAVESCCWSYDVVAATCDHCDARLFEMDIDPDTLPQ
jgi:hypothetical protein